MPDLPELRLKPGFLERYQLPDIGYPIPIEQLEQVISGGGHFPLALLLQGLQQKNQAKDADREALEPAIKRLKELLNLQNPRWVPKRQQKRTVQGRFLGCLLGGAVGDALGAPVEFMTRSDILRQFGANGVTDYAPAYGGLGMITDDTQMTLFTVKRLYKRRGQIRLCPENKAATYEPIVPQEGQTLEVIGVVRWVVHQC